MSGEWEMRLPGIVFRGEEYTKTSALVAYLRKQVPGQTSERADLLRSLIEEFESRKVKVVGRA